MLSQKKGSVVEQNIKIIKQHVVDERFSCTVHPVFLTGTKFVVLCTALGQQIFEWTCRSSGHPTFQVDGRLEIRKILQGPRWLFLGGDVADFWVVATGMYVSKKLKNNNKQIFNSFSLVNPEFGRLRSKTYQDSIKVTERCQEVVRWLVIPCERRTYPPEGCQNRIQFCMINFFFTQFLIKMTHMLKGKQLVVWSTNQMVIEIWPKSETQTRFGQFKSWFQVVNDAAHPNHNQDLCEAVNISYCSWK